MDVSDIIYYAFLAGFFGLMAYVVWQGYANFKARRMTEGILMIVLCVGMFGFGAWIGAIPGFGFVREGVYCQNLFGRWMALPQPRLNYDSARSFHGDGYSINVIDMPEDFWSWLKANEASLLKSYPKKPFVRDDWVQVLWHRSPLLDAEKPFLDFASAQYGGAVGQHAEARELFLTLATSEGSIIAYCHKTFSDRVSDIDFYLLNPHKKVFISVNHNT
jgi:hypothetical protein